MSARSAVAQAQPAEVSPEREAEYRSVVERAVAEFDLGHATEARALFLRAHELWPSARTRRTLGMTAFELRLYPRALEELQGALDDPRRPLPLEQRAQVLDLIEQTKVFVGRFQLEVVPASAEVLVDGTPRTSSGALVLGIGAHQLVARSPGHRELHRELTVQGREDEPLVLRLEPLPAPVATSPALSAASPARNHTPAWIAFGVAAAAVVVGTVSGSIAFSKKHDLAERDAGYLAADISTVAFIAAGAGAVAGTLLWIYAPRSDTPPALSAGPFQVQLTF